MRTALSSLSRERPVLIAGPTASGKSALAIELAARDGRVVVNADALQVWNTWRVLTARPSAADEAAVPHALYGHLGRDAEYSVGHWLREVAGYLAGPRPVVIVGGTGLYLTALTEGLADVPPVPPEVRAAGNRLLAEAGLSAMLAELDAESAARLDQANPARVQRAWEVLRATGRGLATWHTEGAPPLLPLSGADALLVAAPRDWLAARIDARFDAMLRDGALDEAQAVLPQWDARRPWARAIGAAPLVAHLRGEIGVAAATEAAKASSRQLAKRQRTWFRARMGRWQAFTPS